MIANNRSITDLSALRKLASDPNFDCNVAIFFLDNTNLCSNSVAIECNISCSSFITYLVGLMAKEVSFLETLPDIISAATAVEYTWK
jgi:hypothetical protein